MKSSIMGRLLVAGAAVAALAQANTVVEPHGLRSPDGLPDRLSLDKRSRYYRREVIERGVGVRFKGVEKTNVYEYCVSEGWVRLIVGRTLKADGTPMTTKLQGVVEPYWR